MRTAFPTAVVLGTLLFVTGAGAQDLDAAAVGAVIAQVQAAADEQDLEQFSALLADQTEVLITVISDGTTQTVEMDKDAYLASMNQSWALYDDYRHTREDLRISLHGDYAIVESTINEEISIRGQSIKQSSRNKSTIKLIDGHAKIARIESTVRL